MTSASQRVCGGCGFVPAPGRDHALWPRCANADDGGDHVLLRELDEARLRYGLAGDPSYPDRPFLRWRHRLHAWHLAQAAGWTDAAFVALVDRLEQAIAAVEAPAGRGFRVTPLAASAPLATRLGRTAPLYIKDETHNVAGSHKARHLFGILLALEVLGIGRDHTLAIASCGNAALAATVLASAAGRCIRVFVPSDAEPAIVRRLSDLGAGVEVCERAPGVAGDPCVHRFRAAVAAGAVPFSCQGSDNGLAIEGGETLGWEIVAQLGGAPLDRVFVQVGGGALGSAVGRALQQAVRAGARAHLPRIHAVQTRQVSPFARAYERLAQRLDSALGAPPPSEVDSASYAFQTQRADRLATAFHTPAFQSQLRAAAAHRAGLMWPWEHAAASVAHGILDDETYDWLALVRAMLESGGFPIVVDEATLVRANRLGIESMGSPSGLRPEATGLPADETGSAGLAGLIALGGALPANESCLVLFTGVRR